ncbi:MAG: hypothetical protein MUC89_01815 [Acetobacteraceae bacterium]|jgi:hypothetical protein|nr:hypothetical protein [Acetobacteraceae bacterium]
MRGGALGRLWRGEMPLADAFWTWAVAIGFIVNGSTSIACYALLIADRPIGAIIVGYLLSVPYNIIATVGVLRATRREDSDPALARFVRVIIIPVMVLLSLT